MNRFILALSLSALSSGKIDQKLIVRATFDKTDGVAKVNIYTDAAQTKKDGNLEMDAAFIFGDAVLVQAQVGFDKLFETAEEKANVFTLAHLMAQGDRRKTTPSTRKVSISDTSYETKIFALVYTDRGVRILEFGEYSALEIKSGKVHMVQPGSIDTFSAKTLTDKLGAFVQETGGDKITIEMMGQGRFSPFKSIPTDAEIKKLAMKYDGDISVIQALGQDGVIGELDDDGKFNAKKSDELCVGLSDGSKRNVPVKRHANGDVEASLAA